MELDIFLYYIELKSLKFPLILAEFLKIHSFIFNKTFLFQDFYCYINLNCKFISKNFFQYNKSFAVAWS